MTVRVAGHSKIFFAVPEGGGGPADHHGQLVLTGRWVSNPRYFTHVLADGRQFLRNTDVP